VSKSLKIYKKLLESPYLGGLEIPELTEDNMPVV
jgi:hypothetical protein